jgi:hypothetical protein
MRALSSSLLLALVAVACSSSSTSPASPDAGPTTPAPAPCATDARAQKFTPGLEGTAKAGTLDIKLESISPSPPVKGDNDWTFAVSDASGKPVDGLALKIVPLMPDHGHPASVSPIVTPLGSGTYEAKPVNLFMGGVWQVTVSVPVDGGAGADDSTMFTFCVAD